MTPTWVSALNAFWFAIGAGTGVWSAQGAVHAVKVARYVKAFLSAVYAIGVTIDLFWLTAGEWVRIARYLGLVAIPAVWVLPDVMAKHAMRKIVANIETMTAAVITGEHDVTPGGDRAP